MALRVRDGVLESLHVGPGNRLPQRGSWQELALEDLGFSRRELA